MIRAPEQPNGCPSETAPPFTFTLSLSNPNILEFAGPTTANASLNSNTHIAKQFQLYLAL
jgi:hypothetical protein